MNIGRLITANCVNTAPLPDNRCSDPNFAAANSEICPALPYLLIKPSVALACSLGSVQFKAFLITAGVEQDVTNSSTFTTSDFSIAMVGATSGNATGLSQGIATISATYQDKLAVAELNVLGGNCCNAEKVGMQVIVDNSKSMSLAFSGAYSTRLVFAKAAATRFIAEVNQTKDLVGLQYFNAVDDQILADPTNDKTTVKGKVSAIPQSQQLTSFYAALTMAISEVNASGADLKVLVLISDGEDNNSDYTDANNPITLLSDFKAAGGIVLCVGCRASGKGFRFLQTLATGGFFINAYPGIEADTLNFLSGLKGYICAGNCTPTGDVTVPQGQLNYTGFSNWTVTNGTVDLQGNGFFDVLPGNGLYVDLAGTNPSQKGLMTSKNTFALSNGHSYRVSVELAGNQRINAVPESCRLRVYYLNAGTPVYLLDQKITVNDFAQGFHPYNFTFSAPADLAAYISIQQEDQPANTDPRIGLLLNRVTFADSTNLQTLLDDTFETENIVYVPPRCGIGTTGLPYFSAYSYVVRTNLVPQMTSNTAPSGVALASTQGAGQEIGANAYRLFDRVTQANVWNSTTGNGNITPNAWIQYQFTSGQKIYSYRITPWQQGIAPRDFIFQGSNDGLSWTTLDTQTAYTNWTDVVFDPGSGTFIGTPINFPIATPGTYSYYRLTMSKVVNQGGGTFQVNMAEVELLGDQTIAANTYAYTYAIGYNCYGAGCLSSPPGVQVSDPNPLLDVESGYSPPKQYSSSKTGCADCGSGHANISTVNLVPVMTSNTAPSGVASASSGSNIAWLAFDAQTSQTGWFSASPDGYPSTTNPIWLQYQCASTQTIANYGLRSSAPEFGSSPTAWTLQGSNDGSTWTTLDVRANVQFPPVAQDGTLTELLFPINNPQPFVYYRLTFTDHSVAVGHPVVTHVTVANWAMYGVVGQQICKTGSGTSIFSQADADAKAQADGSTQAQALLTCRQVYTATEQYNASCPVGQFGNPITQSATAQSFNSQQEANDSALAQAKVAALALINCSQSNNTQAITINDASPGSPAAATPYPSVKRVTGLTGTVTNISVAIKHLSHTWPADIRILLRSPNGVTCELMNTCGAGNVIANVDLTFDDSGAALPQNTVIVSGTYKPTAYSAQSNYAAPAPVAPYGTALAVFVGMSAANANGSWSLWCEDVAPVHTGSVGLGWDLTIT